MGKASPPRGYGSTPPALEPAPKSCSWFGTSKETKSDVIETLKLSLTIVAVNLASNVVSPISIMFIGQLGVIELDGINLASTLINCTGFAISGGMTTACDTLIGQAFGSNNKEKVGVYVQQGLVIIMLFVLPIWAIHLNAENLLLLMGQDRAVCRIAGEYLTMTLPAMFFLILYRIIASYLRAIGHLSIPLLAGVIGTIVNIALHYLLVVVYPMGIVGSAIAQDASYMTMVAITLGLMLGRKVYKDTWSGWNVQFLQNWGLFLKIGLAGFGIFFIEFFGGEIGAIQTGLLGTTELGAQSIVFQLYLVMYAVPLGFGIASNVRIAQLLGAGDVARTWKNVKISVALNAAFMLAVVTLVLPLRWEIPRLFSNDPDVIAYTANVIPIFGIHFVLDASLCISSGILRACGRHIIGVAMYLNAYLLIALPLSIVFMFVVKIGVSGFWVATAIGMFITNLPASIYIFCFLNWDNETKRAQQTAGCVTEEERVGMSETPGREGITAAPLQSAETFEYEQDTAETMGLLTYKDMAKRATEMRWKQFYIANIKAFSGGPGYPMDMEELVHKASKEQSQLCMSVLLCRRGIFVSCMVFVLVFAILTRVLIPAPDFTAATEMCLPVNSTNVNSSLSFCNYSMPIINMTSF